MTRRRRALLALAGALLVLLVFVATIVAAVVWGVTIDVSRWRDTAATRLAAALERPVLLQDPFTLTLGREATLHVGGTEIPGPDGFSSREFAALGGLDVRFDLLDALRGSLQVSSIEARSGRLRLERNAEGATNWALARDPAQAPAGELRVAEVALHNLDIEYVDARAAKHIRLAVDEFTASGCCEEPLHVSVRGRTERRSPYAATLAAGPLQPLLAAAAPWPFDAVFEYDNARLAAKGTVAAGADVIELSALQGSLANAEVTGKLTLDLRGARPQLRGALAFSRLDLLISSLDRGAQQSDEGFEQLSVRDLVPLDVEVDLSAPELPGVPGELRDVTVELRAEDGRVHAPMHATWAGIPVSGSLELDTAATVPTLALQLEARDTALRDLPGNLVDATAMSGVIGHMGLRADGRGETVGALIGDMQLALSAAGRLRSVRGNASPPLDLVLDVVDLSVRRGERLRGRARGALQGERVTLAFQAGTLPDMLKSHATPLDLDLAATRTKLHAAGTLAFPGAAEATDLAFGLSAARAGDLARWLPIAPATKLALDARGRVRIDSDGWRLDDGSLKAGRSRLAIDAQRSDRQAGPITRVTVRGPLLDLAQLATLLPTPRANAHDRALPLPEAVRSAQADVEVAIERVTWDRIDVQDLTLVSRLRDGRLDSSPFSAGFAGGRVHGVVAGDVSGAAPQLDLQLTAESVDTGALARALGFAQRIEGRVDAIEVNAQARGSTLRELAQRSWLDARVRANRLTIASTGARPAVEIAVSEATVVAGAGSPVQIRVSGAYDEEPLAFQLTTADLEDLVAGTGRVPIAATGKVADTRLDFKGDLLLPLGRGGEFTVELGGERLDSLNGLAGIELPAWGPWSIRGPVRMTAGSYAMPDVSLGVGTSKLAGSGQLDLTGPRRRLVLDVTAPLIQLDDFPLPERLTDDPASPLTTAGVRATARGVARRTERLLNSRFLQRFDAHIDVRVKEVLSGTDRLADGHLRLQVDDGHLYLGPAQVNLPGGTLTLALAYDPKPAEVDLRVGAYIERFDYGIIVRRLKHGENARGLVSARIDVAGRGPSLETIMRDADGELDFAIWPEELGGRIFNLWSVNLLLAVLPVIDPGGDAHVNCIVGRFDLRDGVVRDDKMLIDTTRVRVRGTGHANLRTEGIDFVFRPRAKGLALFRLQYPLRVTGTLSDYNIGIDRREIVPATLRMLASPILVPWERLTEGPLPRDGADVCTDPLRP